MMRGIASPRVGRLMVTVIALAACAIGGGRLVGGIAVPVMAEIAQDRLDRSFEQRLRMPAQSAALSRTDGRSDRSGSFSLPEQGPIARISVARLGVREIVLAGDGSHEQLAQGPTMIRRTAGQAPVTILAAHRDTHFRFVRDLREGDRVTLQWVSGKLERYRIVRLETVRWDRFAYPLDPLRPLLALTTCYPFDSTEYGGPWRRVVWAERI